MAKRLCRERADDASVRCQLPGRRGAAGRKPRKPTREWTTTRASTPARGVRRGQTARRSDSQLRQVHTGYPLRRATTLTRRPWNTQPGLPLPDHISAIPKLPVGQVAQPMPRRLWCRLRPDRGATSVEMVGYTAVMLAALLVGVQAAVWGLGELACRYAANHALQVTRVQGGSDAAGEEDAATVLDEIHGNLVDRLEYFADRGPTTATVTVTGEAVRVIPFLTLPVGTIVSGPVEVLEPPR